MATRLDDGQANKITGVANGPISGGAWLQCGSYTSTVTADTQANYQPNRILLQNGASGLTFPAGIALQNTASGTGRTKSYNYFNSTAADKSQTLQQEQTAQT